MNDDSSRTKDDDESQEELQNEIAELEDRLQRAKQRLECKSPSRRPPSQPQQPGLLSQTQTQTQIPPPFPQTQTQHHNLLLLSDSALPLGSFAFSSGFESYREHARHARAPWSFGDAFLPLSVASFAAASLPFMLAGYRYRSRYRYRRRGSAAAAAAAAAFCSLADLDDACDAATTCAVARRASVAQGRALLGVWEKSFAMAGAAVGKGGIGIGIGGGGGGADVRRDDGEKDEEEDDDNDSEDPVHALKQFAILVRRSSSATAAAAASSFPTSSRNGSTNNDNDNDNDEDDEDDDEDEDEPLPAPASAHFAPLFGVVALALGLTAPQAAYVFVLGHVRALTSAAMRAGVFGPFQAQRILAGDRVRGLVAAAIAREWDTPFEMAGQTAPALDLWAGRHEVLYSKIFNS